jgi:2-isopropylmalate synthase
VVQHDVDQDGGEVTPAELWAKFEDEYLPTPDHPWGRFRLASTRIDAEEDGETHLVVGLRDRSVPGTEVTTVEGHGNGPIAAFVDALAQFDVDVRVLDYAEHAMSAGGDAKAAAYVECAVGERVLWGVGVDSSIVRASLKAIVSAVNRALRPAEVRG